jgi:hypothetical protein
VKSVLAIRPFSNQVFFRLLIATVVLTSAACNSVPTSMPASKTLTCNERGITLNLAEGWTVTNSGCHFKGPNDTHFVEINSSKESAGRSIELVNSASNIVLKAGLGYVETGARTRITLPNSVGIQQTYKDLADRHIVQLVIENDGRFWQLLLQTPMQNWNTNKEQLMKVLHSARVD